MSADDPHLERDEHDTKDPSDELQAALERSRRHARTAISEALACLGALLDAASLATSGAPADAHGLLRQLAATLADAAAGLAPAGKGDELVDTVAAALDDEIARWERRAETDPDARAVLRAFLGVRELLWELGVRRQGGTRARGTRVARPQRQEQRQQRVQRVHVQGAGSGA